MSWKASSVYPAQAPEVDYPDAMEVRTVKSHGCFRWKKQDVFLSEVLWGERIGLMPQQDGTYTIYFAHLPLAGFNQATCKLVPLHHHSRTKDKNKNLPDKEKLSEMRPV